MVGGGVGAVVVVVVGAEVNSERINMAPEWFTEVMQGCESLSLDKQGDRDMLWIILSSHLMGKRTQRVNSLLGDHEREYAYQRERELSALPVY